MSKIQKTNMVFTSAGDNTNFYNHWFDNNMNYDIYSVYYGNNENNYQLYAKISKFIIKRKGSKFQNFYYFFNSYKDIINKYTHFFLLDDDIIINSTDINKMFDISQKYKLDICGPSFDSDQSKISFPITKHISHIGCKYCNHNMIPLLSYTNFVEVNSMLFNKNSLNNLMKVYDPILIGFGIDLLAIWANGLNEKDKYAIIYIKCINPKKKIREIDICSSDLERRKVWNDYAKKIRCDNIWHGNNRKALIYRTIYKN